jgi:hypothetical protein
VEEILKDASASKCRPTKISTQMIDNDGFGRVAASRKARIEELARGLSRV